MSNDQTMQNTNGANTGVCSPVKSDEFEAGANNEICLPLQPDKFETQNPKLNFYNTQQFQTTKNSTNYLRSSQNYENTFLSP